MKHYLRLLRYVKPYWMRVALMLFLMFFVSGAFAGIIAGFKPLIDILIGDFNVAQYQKFKVFQHPAGEQVLHKLQAFATNDRLEALFVIALFLVSIQILRGFCEVLQAYLTEYVSGRVAIDLTTDLQARLLNQSVSFFERFGVGNAITIAWSDTQALVRGLNLIFSRLIQEPLNIVGAIAVAFAINWRFALFAMLGLPIAGFGASRLGKFVRRRANFAFQDIAVTLSILQEEFFGIKIVKAFTMENEERFRFRKAMGKFFRNRMRIIKAKEWNSPLNETLGAAGVGLLLLFGGRDVIDGRMSSGSFFAFFVALGAIYRPIKSVSKAYSEVQTILASADRVFGMMDASPSVCDSPTAVGMPRVKGEIRFDNVSFTYNGTDIVLRNINAHIMPGETVALVGHSGAGKTTFANLIMRFYDVSAGAITLDGLDLREVTQESLRRNIGLVTQETVLFNGTVAENIGASQRETDRERVVAAAKVANADEFIQSLPQGYDTEIGERGGTLSGGQQQRLAIARTVYKDPPIFILDEATSSLDSHNEALIQEALERLMKGRTTIIIAHRFSTITFADRIIVLNRGEVEMSGTLQECLDNSEAFRNLYEKQFARPAFRS